MRGPHVKEIIAFVLVIDFFHSFSLSTSIGIGFANTILLRVRLFLDEFFTTFSGRRSEVS